MAHRDRTVSRYDIVKKGGARNASADRVVSIVSIGTFVVAILLTVLLFVYDSTVLGHFRVRTFLSIGFLVYTALIVYFAHEKHVHLASWLLISIYQLIVAIMLIQWGIKAPVSVLALCFVTILPGVLLGSRYIFPVFFYTAAIIVGSQVLHVNNLYTPNLTVLSAPSSYWDAVVYITIIAALALVSWLSKNQAEQSLIRAARAEARLLNQKQLIASELKEQSLALRQTQIDQFQQLYQFALIGQSTAATLHELSNQLSELNFDIEDLTQQNKNSQAISSAKDTIGSINLTVRQVRQQLDSHANNRETFDALEIIKRAVDDMLPKYTQQKVELIYLAPKNTSPAYLFGGKMALMQVLSILLRNALQASKDSSHAWVRITARISHDILEIRVRDSGSGISESARKTLFTPKTSTKPDGLGVGLYIAKHLTRTEFHGRIRASKTAPAHGAEFIVALPLSSPIGLVKNEK